MSSAHCVACQDFPAVAGATPARNSTHFGGRLKTFLDYLPYKGLPAQDMQHVRDHCGSVIAGIDFGSASGALVTCMPGGPRGEDKGGWTQLREALADIDAPRTGGPVHIATGHYGAIQPRFLAQMVDTLRRSDSAGDLWHRIGTCFLYHSSRATVLAPQTNSLAVLRTTAPSTTSDATVLARYFHDSLPKFSRASPGELLPILHGKAMLAISADGSKGCMFVGSQNFSKASFGEGNNQPTNVEIGVVIKAVDADAVDELIARFPVHLAPMEAFGTPANDRGYVMARGPTDGDNSSAGLQMRWRMRCNDLGYLERWRGFLHRFWHFCSRCGAHSEHSHKFSPTDIIAMEDAAGAGTPFICSRIACQEGH